MPTPEIAKKIKRWTGAVGFTQYPVTMEQLADVEASEGIPISDLLAMMETIEGRYRLGLLLHDTRRDGPLHFSLPKEPRLKKVG